MRIKLPRWVKGERPKAADMNKLPEAIERLFNLAVDGSTGLQVEWTADGWKLTYIPRPVFYYAVVTTAAPAFSGSTYGKGVATLDVESYSSSNVCTRAASSPTRSVSFYNGGVEIIPVTRRIQVYEKVPGRWHAVTNFCP